jgi:hypothetical protein
MVEFLLLFGAVALVAIVGIYYSGARKTEHPVENSSPPPDLR